MPAKTADPHLAQQLVTVVVPTHLPEPTALGKVSLAQTLSVLGRHPITFVVPDTLDVSWYEDFCRGKADIHFQRIAWRGIDEFGELMLSPQFFERFVDYEYILVCHLDAFVFKDDLADWCRQGYDYIGSVIYNTAWEQGVPLSRRKARVNDALRKLLRTRPTEYLANGGFALKRVRTFLEMTSRFRYYIKGYTSIAIARGRGIWEDLFVLRHFSRLSDNFMIPPRSIAQRFGAEYVDYDEQLLPFGNGDAQNLPFGVHGWIQFQPEYWKPIIRQYGHDV